MSTDDDIETISLGELTHAVLRYTDADGNRQETDPFPCNDPDCEICGGPDEDSDPEQTSKTFREAMREADGW